MLQVNNLTFKYPEESEVLLKNVSFSLNGGDILCIDGLNGSGKTTLLKLISGFFTTHEYQGTVDIANNQKIVFIPTDLSHFLLPWYTFNENISFFDTSGKMLDSKNSIEKGHNLFNHFKNSTKVEIGNRKVYKLSSGEKAYLSLVCGLIKGPSILILDEIFSNIHNSNAKLVIEFLKTEFITNNTAIVFTSHYPELVNYFYNKTFKLS